MGEDCLAIVDMKKFMISSSYNIFRLLLLWLPQF